MHIFFNFQAYKKNIGKNKIKHIINILNNAI